jgi:hypothetical protein
MMMATWRGRRGWASFVIELRSGLQPVARSNLHDLLLLGVERIINLMDVTIGELL